AEQIDLTGKFGEFQLADDPEEREWGYCMVDSPATSEPFTSVPHGTVYVGVTKCIFAGRELRLEFNESAQQTLGWPPAMQLSLEVDEATIGRLRAALRQLLSVPPAGEMVDYRE